MADERRDVNGKVTRTLRHQSTAKPATTQLMYHGKSGRTTGCSARALQWSENPYGNGYGVEMDENWAQFLKMLWIGLDVGKAINLNDTIDSKPS